MLANIVVTVKFNGGGSWTHEVNNVHEEEVRTLMEFATSIESARAEVEKISV